MSQIQSVIFGTSWTAKDARKWLKDNKLKPIGKVHKGAKIRGRDGGSLKYTIHLKKDFKEKLGFISTKKGISFIIGTLKN